MLTYEDAHIAHQPAATRARPGPLPALLLLLALAIAGCGKSDQEAARSSVETYITAFADGDGERACEQLAASARRDLADGLSTLVPELDPLDCRGFVERATSIVDEGQLDRLAKAKVSEVEVDGESASARFDLAGTQTVQLKKVDGDWKIASLDFGLGSAASGSATPIPSATPEATPEPEPEADVLAEITSRLERAGYEPQDDDASDAKLLGALIVDDVHVLEYESASAAKAGGQAIRSAISGAAPENGEVEIRGARVYWIGKERALKERDLAQFRDIFATAEGE